MTGDRIARRQEKLLQLLSKQKLSHILITCETNVRYLTGFTGEDSYLLIGKQHTLLLSDSRFETQIQQECPGLEAVIRTAGVSMSQTVAEVLHQCQLAQVAVESSSLSHMEWERMQSELGSIIMISVAGLVEELRSIKDPHEISQIKAAIDQAERGFAVLKSTLELEQTELQAAHNLEHAMRSFGALNASFPPIIAVGTRAALPHARPTQQTIGSAAYVLIDWGCVNENGYASDLTRILVTGKLSSKVEKVYRVVLNAQLKAIEKIRPGVCCGDVDSAARRVIADAGYGKQFGHGLGHGVGLNVHELPRLGPNVSTILEPGMVVTVEPGIYLPDWGGVRIEDDVLITNDGCEVLSSVTKSLDECSLA